MTQETLSREFTVHKLNDTGITIALGVGQSFNRLLEQLHALCGVEGREMAIVRTKLEEACFFAKKAVANKKENQLETY